MTNNEARRAIEAILMVAEEPIEPSVLAQLTDAPLGNGHFPYMTARELDLAFAPVLALRVTYLGELGYELRRHHLGLVLWAYYLGKHLGHA